MITQIELNPKLVQEALQLTQLTTEQELIDFALQELIRTRKKRNLLDLSGQIQFSTTYDYKALRENRLAFRIFFRFFLF
ncbi:type II toxin-antitoxin system VapB family antitoxin [Spirulina sp. 06S082]|uniref:type II toxin-antitoxin system VapB family antitoxin n=1 Tax=Spirulina sp. 06S082 TaxID=3110248 RepID=UPI002B1F8F39|nr:type II toxin-antitoxin system VapB family antitoxin [Spirulina sp. 06S082]MEA5471647.1 type II toxin-antitoxin system VapB family antitoxin [Spirulina sp. 06S082]